MEFSITVWIGKENAEAVEKLIKVAVDATNSSGSDWVEAEYSNSVVGGSPCFEIHVIDDRDDFISKDWDDFIDAAVELGADMDFYDNDDGGITLLGKNKAARNLIGKIDDYRRCMFGLAHVDIPHLEKAEALLDKSFDREILVKAKELGDMLHQYLYGINQNSSGGNDQGIIKGQE